MKPDERNVDELLKRALPSAPRDEMEAALDRVYDRLQADRGWTVAEPPREVEPQPRFVWSWRPAVTIAAAVIAVATAIWFGASLRDRGVYYAILETADATLYRVADGPSTPLGTGSRVPVSIGDRIRERETVRSNGDNGAVLALVDGSRVEMRSQSELSLDRADDGLTIRLTTGSIIVNAAKQPAGHLYVQTRDVTVSVVGTVFLVNAESDGSRVAVIEGEVRVQKGTTGTNLRPGEQVSTSPSLVARPVKEEIAWSRHLDAHLLLLQRTVPQNIAHTPEQAASASVAPDKAAQDKPSQFEEASIRECDPDNLPPTPAGARGGGVNSFQMTPGRLHVQCMTLATIVRTAFDYGPAELEFMNAARGGRMRGMRFDAVYGLGVEDGLRVRRGPDWIRTARYSIDAVAEGTADAETMKGPMLRALLERRFQLKAHVESEQVPAFTLSVAKGGFKLKPMAPDGCEPLPNTPGQPSVIRPRSAAEIRRGEKPHCGLFGSNNGPNGVFVGGGAVMQGLTMVLGSRLGGVQVIDRTGITDRFNFILEFARDENAPGLRGERDLFGPTPLESADIPRAPTITVAIEEQIGLKLESAKASRDFLVVDQIERPSPN